jgi:N-methylhydantoinase A
MTAAAVDRAAIAAPLMIMRSDGGVMDVREIEHRPILTLLSGPAAGVAGALLYDNVSDGIFVEVGGTSSDCSAIRAGRPQMRAAKIGGHRAMLRTLDVRTLGIAGGSLAKIAGGAIVDVGPRSAHIAGYAYACFVDAAPLDGARVDEESEYAVVLARDGTRVAVTPSCAANLLGAVPSDAFARGNAESARRAFALLAQRHGGDAESLARQLLDIAARKLRAGIEELIAEYGLDRGHVVVVGGGGGAGSIVPYAAAAMGLPWRIARDAEVISPIGVALALVRDVVERIVVNPSPEEVARIRREAADRVVAAGASPDRVEVQVEIDSQRNLVRATASGATEIAESAALPVAAESERRAAAARSMRCEPGELREIELTERLRGYGRSPDVRVVDERGVVRLALRDAAIQRASAGELESRVRQAIEAGTRFGDVGRAVPALYLLRGARVAAFEGLANGEQGVALALEEIEGCDAREIVALITVAKQA